jgi:tetratricopeptide (TPR) repeat protein
MPKTVTGVLDHFADHSLDVPVPENTVEHGVPNACGVCHEKLSAAAQLKQVAVWWPNSTRRARRVRLAAAFDEKTKAGSEAALVAVVTDQTEAPLLRGFAAELLGQRFALKASEVLPGVLGASDAYLRSRALSGLSAARAKGAANEVARLLTDSSVVVREFAALLLLSWGDARGQSALESLASGDETRTLARPHLVLAQRLASSGQFERARKELSQVLEVMPYSAGALVLQADLAMQARDPDLARAALEEALRFDPANEGARGRLGVLSGEPAGR